jgi:hypothetical protein
MKNLLLTLLLAGAARAATITATISYVFTTAVACSATVTANCMQYFEVGTLSGATFTSYAQVALPATLSGSVTLPPASFPFNGVYGAVQFAAVVMAKDLNGNNLPSVPFAPATAVVSVLPSPPSGLTVSAGP